MLFNKNQKVRTRNDAFRSGLIIYLLVIYKYECINKELF
jgi:hypothetical protein